MPTTDLARPHGDPPTSTELTVTVLEDPLRVRHGFPISSAYVETFWLSHLGPSAICLLRLFDRLCRHQPNHQVTLSVIEEATEQDSEPRCGAEGLDHIDRVVASEQPLEGHRRSGDLAGVGVDRDR